MSHLPSPSVLALIVVGLVACHDEKPKTEPTQPAVAAAAAPAMKAPAPPAPAAAREGVSGTVAETMNGGGYTYLRLTTAAGEKWAAVPQSTVAVGDKVTLVNPMVMEHFASPTLKRSFDEILFATLAPAGGGPQGMPAK